LLKRLADTIGEPVVVTRGGRLQVTPAGREVAALCDEILASFERFEARLKKPGSEPACHEPK
jgi:DNA-binding transcriptional LysR family regulator